MLLLDVSALYSGLHLTSSTLYLLLLHLNVSRLHGPLLLPEHDYTTEACDAPGHVYTTGASASHRRAWSKGAWAAPGSVYTTWAWAAPVSTLQWPVLYLIVSTPQGSELHQCLHYRGLCCTWTCLLHRGLVWTRGPYSAAPGRVYVTTGAWDAPGRVYTTDVCVVTRRVYTPGPKEHLNPRLHISGLR